MMAEVLVDTWNLNDAAMFEFGGIGRIARVIAVTANDRAVV